MNRYSNLKEGVWTFHEGVWFYTGNVTQYGYRIHCPYCRNELTFNFVQSTGLKEDGFDREKEQFFYRHLACGGRLCWQRQRPDARI